MKLSLRHALGAVRIFRRRAGAVGQPGLATWGETAEGALSAASCEVAGLAFANEHAEGELAAEVRAMLRSARRDRAQARSLKRLSLRLAGCATRSRAIGDAVKL